MRLRETVLNRIKFDCLSQVHKGNIEAVGHVSLVLGERSYLEIYFYICKYKHT